jgi:hypothetical protein
MQIQVGQKWKMKKGWQEVSFVVKGLTDHPPHWEIEFDDGRQTILHEDSIFSHYEIT